MGREIEKCDIIWVWLGEGWRPHPSAIFTDRRAAHDWITQNKLQGVLTAYPVGISVYDWAISKGYFKPEGEEEKTPTFIQNFDTEYLSHYHYSLENIDHPDEYFAYPDDDFENEMYEY